MGTLRGVALLVATGMLIGGCGSSGSGSSGKDAKEIEAVTVKAVTTHDATIKCIETVTTNFVNTVYHNLPACKQEEAKNTGKPPTGATVTDIKVSGDTATATVTDIGGDAAGASGQLSYAKEKGAWKVDDLSIGYLRSELTAGLKHGTAELADPKVRKCLGDGLGALPDTQLKTIAYDSIGGRDNQDFLKIANGCLSQSTAASGSGDATQVSALRKKFEEGITQSAKADGKSQTVIDCVNKELRTSISDADILAEVNNNGKTSTKLTKAAAVAIIDCGGQ
jgi:hypothetical protein